MTAAAVALLETDSPVLPPGYNIAGIGADLLGRIAPAAVQCAGTWATRARLT